MSKFKIMIQRTFAEYVEIEADTVSEAIEKAEAKGEDFNFDDTYNWEFYCSEAFVDNRS